MPPRFITKFFFLLVLFFANNFYCMLPSIVDEIGVSGQLVRKAMIMHPKVLSIKSAKTMRLEALSSLSRKRSLDQDQLTSFYYMTMNFGMKKLRSYMHARLANQLLCYAIKRNDGGFFCKTLSSIGKHNSFSKDGSQLNICLCDGCKLKRTKSVRGSMDWGNSVISFIKNLDPSFRDDYVDDLRVFEVLNLSEPLKILHSQGGCSD